MAEMTFSQNQMAVTDHCSANLPLCFLVSWWPPPEAVESVWNVYLSNHRFLSPTYEAEKHKNHAPNKLKYLYKRNYKDFIYLFFFTFQSFKDKIKRKNDYILW